MKKKLFRQIKLWLTTIILFNIVSCTNEPTENGIDTSESQTTDASTDTEIPLGIPDDYSLNGKTIRAINTQNYIAGDSEGDIVSQAEYNMIMKVEETLDMNFEFINFLNTDYQNIPSAVQKSVNSGSDDYDLIFCPARLTIPLQNEGYYIPVSQLPYVDLSKPWWAKSLINSISVNSNAPTLMTGAITYCYLERLACVFFNKQLLEDIKQMSDTDIYNLVLDGKWTIDKFGELNRDVYQDLNGNNIQDDSDRYGTVLYNEYIYDRMAYSSGISFTSRSSDGYPELNLNNEKTVDLISKLNSIYISNENTMQLKTFSASNRYDKVLFANGQVLFLPERLYVASWDELRSMDDDFGIIPSPKYDESIKTYQSVSDNNTILCSVPVTAVDLEAISAVAEAMAYYGQEIVTPVYYETALKIKYTRDDLSVQMIDLISQNASTDFLYFNTLGGLGSIFGEIYNSGGENFASLYASYESTAKANLDKITKTLNAQ